MEEKIQDRMTASRDGKQVDGSKNWTQVLFLCWVPVISSGSAVLGAGQSVH